MLVHPDDFDRRQQTIVQVANGFRTESALDYCGGLDNDIVMGDEMLLHTECGEGSGGSLVILVAFREERDERGAID
jgi:hypothetical protein